MIKTLSENPRAGTTHSWPHSSQMSREEFTSENRAPGLVVSLLLIFALVGCSGSATPTSRSEPVAAPKSVLTSVPTPAIAVPTPASQEYSTIGPITTVDVPPTDSAPSKATPSVPILKAFPLPAGSRPHDVAPAIDGGVWYTAQGSGELGWLDPETGETRHTPLGAGSRPHGVIVGPDGAPWVTDGGLNAIVSQVVAAHAPVPVEAIALSGYGESGKPAELLEKYGLTAVKIAEATHRAVGRKR